MTCTGITLGGCMTADNTQAKRPNLIFNGENDRGPVMARGFDILRRNHEKSGRIVSDILNIT